MGDSAITHHLRVAAIAINEAMRHMPPRMAARTKWHVKRRTESLIATLGEIRNESYAQYSVPK